MFNSTVRCFNSRYIIKCKMQQVWWIQNGTSMTWPNPGLSENRVPLNPLIYDHFLIDISISSYTILCNMFVWFLRYLPFWDTSTYAIGGSWEVPRNVSWHHRNALGLSPIFIVSPKAMDRFGIDKPDLRYDMETLGVDAGMAGMLGLGCLVARRMGR